MVMVFRLLVVGSWHLFSLVLGTAFGVFLFLFYWRLGIAYGNDIHRLLSARLVALNVFSL